MRRSFRCLVLSIVVGSATCTTGHKAVVAIDAAQESQQAIDAAQESQQAIDATQESQQAIDAAQESQQAIDAAQESPEAGVAHQCQLNAQGGCSATTPDTTCMPLIGFPYDDNAGCVSTLGRILQCCAQYTGRYCMYHSMVVCSDIPVDGGTVTYVIPEPLSTTTGRPCNLGPYCGSTSADADQSDEAMVASDGR